MALTYAAATVSVKDIIWNISALELNNLLQTADLSFISYEALFYIFRQSVVLTFTIDMSAFDPVTGHSDTWANPVSCCLFTVH